MLTFLINVNHLLLKTLLLITYIFSERIRNIVLFDDCCNDTNTKSWKCDNDKLFIV